MAASRPTRPSTVQQLTTGTLINSDPQATSRLLTELCDALTDTQRQLAQAKTAIAAAAPLFTATKQGDVPASGGGTANFLRADGTWSPPPSANPGFAGSSFIDAGTLNASVNDWAPTGIATCAGILVDFTSGAIAITGITGGYEGRMLWLIWKGVTSSGLTSHLSGSSAAANRIFNPQATASYGINSAFLMLYQGGRWHIAGK